VALSSTIIVPVTVNVPFSIRVTLFPENIRSPSSVDTGTSEDAAAKPGLKVRENWLKTEKTNTRHKERHKRHLFIGTPSWFELSVE